MMAATHSERAPSYRVPPATVRLGRPLELVVHRNRTVTTYGEPDFAGFHMLVPPGAEDMAPGRVRLYLVRPTTVKPGGRVPAAGAQTFDNWHDRDPDGRLNLDGLPERIGVRLGRALRLDYASDKWSRARREVEYTHAFGSGQPWVYADNQKAPRAFVLVGGDMHVTRHGIE